MFWLQHHWCLYICWLVQLPAMCCFVPLALLAWAFGHDSPKYGAEDQLIISLCFIMILVYVYQIFFYFLHRLAATRMLCVQIYQSIFVAIFIFYFRAVLFPFHSPPDDWLPVARAIWIGLPVTL
ncbi:uncharacterized protein M437DRAFT_55678 [Aureobasidium melanogenum CBS 110374]|uniref:Uncharacterized protein n=1 Tax=Aureobasidium melanogenum (strain CBS 110374) TaxID=1043003 RepID=A0A074VLA8_AURM1|nr:uncharacterized protein M437DRAFT_55678 [Aureobasidium melanogenum CBS 110374]KEQ59899.1 hypothetical protein M437DRAFT_55678 [Aureobasidium melanogenum CBS 110374]